MIQSGENTANQIVSPAPAEVKIDIAPTPDDIRNQFPVELGGTAVASSSDEKVDTTASKSNDDTKAEVVSLAEWSSTSQLKAREVKALRDRVIAQPALDRRVHNAA